MTQSVDTLVPGLAAVLTGLLVAYMSYWAATNHAYAAKVAKALGPVFGRPDLEGKDLAFGLRAAMVFGVALGICMVALGLLTLASALH